MNRGAASSSRGRLFWLAGLALGVLWGCVERSPRKDPFESAKFGVFFGGQLQQREQIPFEVNPAKQSHGFRIEFAEPLKEDMKIAWELTMPGTSKRVRDERGRRGRGRLTVLGGAIARPGQKRYERVMHFKPGDPLGMWNIRVVARDRVLIDRPFLVYDPVARRRAMQDGGR